MNAYKRIKELAKVVDDLILSDAIVADIGCDHGYLSELLDRNPKVKTVYATDISEKCLEKVSKLKQDFGLKKIKPLLGDGLNPIDKADVTIISGIGGQEISKMIMSQNKNSNGELKSKIFVLQPAQNIYELRKFIYANKYYVLCDYVIKDNKKFYPIIAIDVSKKQYNRKSLYNLYLGRDSKNYSNFEEFLLNFKENLAFLQFLENKNIRKDKILKRKFKILKIVDRQLNKQK